MKHKYVLCYCIGSGYKMYIPYPEVEEILQIKIDPEDILELTDEELKNLENDREVTLLLD